jgi:hypothetical protein
MMPMDLDAAALNLMRLRISRITATLARGRKADIAGKSESCQKLTHAPQQNA